MSCEILSLARIFGVRSETWLYNQIAGLRIFRVHVLTYNYLNVDEYPHSPLTIFPAKGVWTSRLLKLPVFLLEGKKPQLDLRERMIIRGIVNRDGIRIIQAHFGWVGCHFLELTSKYSLPYIVWLYGSDVFRAEWQKNLKELIESPAIFCCTSDALKRQIEASGCAHERVDVFHPGIRIPQEKPKRRNRPGEGLRIISVGRLMDFKDPCGMTQVAGILKGRGLNFIWEHLGDGELRAEVEQQIKRYGLESDFRLRGEVSNEQVVEALKSADIVVHNAVVAPDGGREAFGVVLVEASAAGVPIVSVRVGGIPEIVQDQKTGFLLEEGDKEGMAEKVIMLAKNPEMIDDFGKAAHGYALEHFELSRQIEKLEAFYSSQLNNSAVSNGVA